MATPWESMQSPWSLSHKIGTYLQGKIHVVFHMKSYGVAVENFTCSFPHGNPVVGV